MSLWLRPWRRRCGRPGAIGIAARAEEKVSLACSPRALDSLRVQRLPCSEQVRLDFNTPLRVQRLPRSEQLFNLVASNQSDRRARTQPARIVA